MSVIVIGGGAAGLMAAAKAAEKGEKTVVLEKNDRPGRKLMITGKGRCNVTNACTVLSELTEQIPGNGRFLYSAFSRFMPYDTMELFESLGVELKIERGNRVFPASDKAVDIVDALVSYAKKSGAVIRTGVTVTEIVTENNEVRGVKTQSGEFLAADRVIVATGGKSYPGTGSTGDGYKFAQSAGHGIVTPKPSLIPLETEETWVRRVQGLSLKNIAVKIRNAQIYSVVYEDFGEMLFTHFGVSGPVILSASAHLRDITPGKYELSIDLKPGLSEEKLDLRIIRDFTKYSNKTLPNALCELLPRSLIPVITEKSGIDADRKVNQITKDERRFLGYIIKNLSLNITGTRPIEEAIVTAGGVKTDEINPGTMESKLCKGLYFAGEVIDADAYTGGFNLQIAFATGALAGNGGKK